MALTQQDLETIAEMIRVSALESKQSAQCEASRPHIGRLMYIRGKPSYYICECGKRYQKDGEGGLMDMLPALVTPKALVGGGQ